MDVPEPPELNDTLLELKLSLGPLGEQTADRDTVPVKPFRLARLMVTVPVVPWTRVRELTLVLRLKSRTLTVSTIECVNEPLVAVTVTV